MKREDFVTAIEKLGFRWDRSDSKSDFYTGPTGMQADLEILLGVSLVNVHVEGSRFTNLPFDKVLSRLEAYRAHTTLHARILAALDACPLSYMGDSLVLDEGATPKKVVAWIKRLEALRDEMERA